MSKAYDIIVYGASGFTGKRVFADLLKNELHKSLRIAIAGRSVSKLKSVLDDVWLVSETGKSGIGIISANTEDEKSLVAMCQQGKVILNCVGPYRFHGEAVVKACIRGVSDYIDITGEPEFMERIMSKYFDEACEKGVYIILACGFDCIPSELGTIFAKEKFKGTLGSVENFFTLTSGRKGMTGNYGTYASLVNSISSASSLRSYRKSHEHKKLPLCGPKMKLRSIHYKGSEGKYALPFLGADVSVVRRSQRFYYEQRNEMPAQFSMYYCADFLQMVCIVLFFLVLRVLTSFSWGTKLLLDYPRFFSAGLFNKTGPSDEQIAEAGFKFTMHCKGYSEIVGPEENASKPYNSSMTVKINGPEIGYALTPIAMNQSAMSLLEERSCLPGKGGVYTPGPAFHDTSLIKRLQDNGVLFQAEYH